MTETGTAKVKIAVEARLMSSGTGSRRLWVAQVGAFEGRSTRKPDALAELAASIEKAVLRTDLGAVVRVGVADGRAYVLHSRHDGGYELCSAPLPAAGQVSSVDTTGPDYVTRAVAVDDFASRVERAQEGAKAPPNAEVALRKLADRLGVDAAGDWQGVAQRVAMAFAEADRRGVLAEADAAAARTVIEVSAAGESPEGAALARLLGLRGSFDLRPDPAQVRRAAESILADSRGERWTLTLADVRDPGEPWVRVVSRLAGAGRVAEEVQLRIDNGEIVKSENVEQFVVDSETRGKPDGWAVGGPIDMRIAELIKDAEDGPTVGLYGEARKALDALLGLAVAGGKSDAQIELDDVAEILEAALVDYGFVERRKAEDMDPKALARKVVGAVAATDQGAPARVVDLCSALRVLGLPELWPKYRRPRGCRVRRFQRAPAQFGLKGFLPLAHLPGCAEVGLDENADVVFDCVLDCPADRVDEGDRLAALLAELCDELDHRGCVTGRPGQRRGVGAVVDEARSLLKQYGRIQ